MKKSLLVLALASVMGLVACGNVSSSSSVISSTSSNSSSSSSQSSSDDGVYDIKVVVTVAGITVDTTQNSIWMNTPLGMSDGTWGSFELTQDAEDATKWTYDFTSIENGNYPYNIYVAEKTKIETWTYINSEGSSATPRSLMVAADGDMNVTATFTSQPDSTKGFALYVSITDLGFPTDDADTAWPQIVYKKTTGTEYTWTGMSTQCEDDKTVFSKTITGVDAATYTCYIYRWDGTAGLTYKDTGSVEFTFTVDDSSLDLAFSGTCAAADGVGTLTVTDHVSA